MYGSQNMMYETVGVNRIKDLIILIMNNKTTRVSFKFNCCLRVALFIYVTFFFCELFIH